MFSAGKTGVGVKVGVGVGLGVGVLVGVAVGVGVAVFVAVGVMDGVREAVGVVEASPKSHGTGEPSGLQAPSRKDIATPKEANRELVFISRLVFMIHHLREIIAVNQAPA
jgi:hypothetical protein